MGRFSLLPIKSKNNNGCMVKATKIADRMPISETRLMECKAGCFAKISTPIPKIVVMADRRIEVLCVVSNFSPLPYSLSSPVVKNIL